MNELEHPPPAENPPGTYQAPAPVGDRTLDVSAAEVTRRLCAPDPLAGDLAPEDVELETEPEARWHEAEAVRLLALWHDPDQRTNPPDPRYLACISAAHAHAALALSLRKRDESELGFGFGYREFGS